MKTVFIIGAGSTSILNMPTTMEQVNVLINKVNNSNSSALLCKLRDICQRKFGVSEDKNIEYNFSVNDIFNLIDSNLLLHNGIYEENTKIDFFELEQCKKEFIALLFSEFKQRIFGRNKENYNLYVDFYRKIAEKEISQKKEAFYKTTIDREDFISSYSIVNFNWDLYSLLPIIEAHNLINHTNSNFLPIVHNPQLRIFTDFQCEYGVSGEKLWYPYTEPSAFQVNSSKNDSSRKVITVKCFYPHGSMNLFKCPCCGKHSYFLGNLTIDSVNDKLRFEKDYSLYKCPYCSYKIGGFDFDMLPQSNFKVRNSYLEEIRLSMMSEIQNAGRIIFIGYSMPVDDVDYHTLFKGLNSKSREIYVVLKGQSANQFVTYDALNKYDKELDSVKHFCETFKSQQHHGNLYFNMAGVPNAFDSIVDIM